MAKTESFRSYKHRLDTALDNQFLRQAMDRFTVAYRTSSEEETCCGFGGSFSTTFPAVSREITVCHLSELLFP